MQPFGQFIMRSRRNAGLLALAFAILPLLNWAAIVIMALVTLRRGAKEGALILACVLLPGIVWVMLSKNQTMLLNMVVGSILVWILAWVLHRSHSWSLTLLVGAGIAIVIIVCLHSYIDGINAWWQAKMATYLNAAGSEMQMDTTAQQATIMKLAKIATGLQAAAVLLIDLLWLIMARYWQAVLYNPGKLRGELHTICLPKWSSVVLIVIALLAWLTAWPQLIDILPVVAVVFALAGLSVVHYVIYARKMNWILLVLLYLVLIFALPYMVVALVIVAMCDSWLNLRKRYVTKT
jgi:hypothetical protein